MTAIIGFGVTLAVIFGIITLILLASLPIAKEFGVVLVAANLSLLACIGFSIITYAYSEVIAGALK